MRNLYMFSLQSPQASGTNRNGMVSTGTGFIRIDLDSPFILNKVMFVLQDGVAGPCNGCGTSTAIDLEIRMTDLSSGRRLFQCNNNGIDNDWLPAEMFCGIISGRSSIGRLFQFDFPPLPEECEIPANGIVQVDMQSASNPGTFGRSLGGVAYLTLMGYSYE